MDASLEVTETIREAADQIFSHSFAVYRVHPASAAKIQAAYKTAVGFFRESSVSTTKSSQDDVNGNITRRRRDLVERYRRVKNGNLYGYNIPLESKELYRTWHNPAPEITREYHGGDKKQEEKQQLDNFRNQQPWPSDEFCVASFHLAKELHQLLSECLQHMIVLGHSMHEQKRNNVENDASFSKSSREHRQQRKIKSSSPPPKKRFRTSADVAPDHFDARNENDSISNICDNESDEKDLLWPSFRSSLCPLDFFFYHNRVPNAVNCSEHIDRGALIVVCLTDVPGLEVHSSASQTFSFQCPERLVHNENLYQERMDDLCCSDLVCIMAGDQLSKVLTLSKSTLTPNACVHRVRNPLKCARVSMSYELRLDDC